jgi:hypothetical protein
MLYFGAILLVTDPRYVARLLCLQPMKYMLPMILLTLQPMNSSQIEMRGGNIVFFFENKVRSNSTFSSVREAESKPACVLTLFVWKSNWLAVVLNDIAKALQTSSR